MSKVYVVFLIGFDRFDFVFEVFECVQFVFVDDYIVVNEVYLSVVFYNVFGYQIICYFVDFGDVEDFFDFCIVKEGFMVFWRQQVRYGGFDVVYQIVDYVVVVDFDFILGCGFVGLFVGMYVEVEDWCFGSSCQCDVVFGDFVDI